MKQNLFTKLYEPEIRIQTFFEQKIFAKQFNLHFPLSIIYKIIYLIIFIKIRNLFYFAKIKNKKSFNENSFFIHLSFESISLITCKLL